MIPHTKSFSMQRASFVLFHFVREHYHKTYADDDAVLLGQLSKLVEEGPAPSRCDQRSWHRAVSKAVSAH